jgi:osmoprotectant transport system ATP-binding protein
MIRFEKVSKRYPGEAGATVENLDLHVRQGEICMLVGPSGSGKTTLMKMVNKLIEPSSGTIRIGGRDVRELDTIALRLNIGYIIQEIGLFPHMTVAENIATVPRELGWSRERIAARIDELLELVDLDPALYRRKRPRELSGGQKQRVGVARALAGDPSIMLMDEPFGALDPITRTKVQDVFLHIQEKIRKTIVFVTHDVEEAIKMGDRIAVLKSGRILQLGTPMEILTRPADGFVSDLLGNHKALRMMNLLTCEQLMRPLPEAAPGSGAIRLPLRATAQDALSEMLRTGERSIHLEDRDHRVRGVLHLDDLFQEMSHAGRSEQP